MAQEGTMVHAWASMCRFFVLSNQPLRPFKRFGFGGERYPCTWRFFSGGEHWLGTLSEPPPQASLSQKQKKNIVRLSTFNGFSPPTVPEPKRCSHFSQTALGNCQRCGGASSCDCDASQNFPWQLAAGQAAPSISSFPHGASHSLYKSRCEGNHLGFHFLIITIEPQCLFPCSLLKASTSSRMDKEHILCAFDPHTRPPTPAFGGSRWFYQGLCRTSLLYQGLTWKLQYSWQKKNVFDLVPSSWHLSK